MRLPLAQSQLGSVPAAEAEPFSSQLPTQRQQGLVSKALKCVVRLRTN